MKFRVIFLIFMIPTLIISNRIYATDYSPKISPGLRYLTSLNNDELFNLLSKTDFFALKIINNNYYAGCFIESSNNYLNAEKSGIIITSSAKSENSIIFSAWIPVSNLKNIAATTNIKRIELAVRNELAISKNLQTPSGEPIVGCNVPIIKSDNTGNRVIAGIIDTGIDWMHRDFSDSLQENVSRVIGIWDQTQSPGTYTKYQDNYYSYGKKYSKEELNTALKNKSKIQSADDKGHGTHAAGIIAGNGFGAEGGFDPDDMRGIAPYSEIISVKTDRYSNSIADAVSYIFYQASLLTKPAAVNLSMGNHFGSHDGTSLFERYLSANLGEGKILIASAGNDRAKQIHLSKSFKGSDSNLF